MSSGPPSSPDPDLTVTSKTNYHVGSDESAPWTEQHAGCGRSGLGVKIPSDFFQFESVADANVTLSGGRKRFYKDTWELRHKGKNTNKLIFINVLRMKATRKSNVSKYLSTRALY